MAKLADEHNYEKGTADEGVTRESSSNTGTNNAEVDVPKGTLAQRTWRTLKTPGSALQIVIAALIAIAIGLAVSATVNDIPEAAPAILEIPGALWLRALRATGECLWQGDRLGLNRCDTQVVPSNHVNGRLEIICYSL